MNKKELITAVSVKSDVSKADVESVIDAFVAVVSEEVSSDGGTIRIPGFGNFSRKDVAARMARNPRTGEAIQVPAKQKTIFRFAKSFDD